MPHDEIDYEQLQKFTCSLPVSLNETELDKYGETLASCVNERELLEAKKKAETAKWNGLIKLKDQEILRLAQARAKGEELREVVCVERLRGNVLETIRLDTKGVVSCRPADAEALQATLPHVDTTPMPGQRSTANGTVIQLVQPVIDPGGDVIPAEAGGEQADEAALAEDLARAEADGAVASDTTEMLESAENSEAGAPVESSTGDGVFIGDSLQCPLCGKPISEDDEREEADGCIVHSACLSGNEDKPAEKPAEKPAGGTEIKLSNGMTIKIGDAAHEKAKAKRQRSAKKNGEKKGDK